MKTTLLIIVIYAAPCYVDIADYSGSFLFVLFDWVDINDIKYSFYNKVMHWYYEHVDYYCGKH
jgi:hypothetical protein